jgi:hypothetical protein
MQKVDADALQVDAVYAIFDKRENPPNGVYMTGTFSGAYDLPVMRGLVAFKNVTMQGRHYESMAFPKAKHDFYLVEPKPPLTGGRGRKRRTHRRRNGKKHVVRRRKTIRKH